MLKFTQFPARRPLRVRPDRIDAILPAVQGPEGALVGKVVGSVILVRGVQIMICEMPDDVAQAVETALTAPTSH